MTWETAIPNVAGVNVAIGFEFRVRVYDWDIVNGKGSLLRTVEPYTPIDWDLASTTFDFTLADIIAVSSDIYNVKRGFTFEIDAFVTDSNGNKTYSSTSNTNGFDRVHAWNKPPSKAATPSGFLDINAHIKVFDTQRPIDAQSVYIIASKGGEHAGLCSVSGNDRKTKVTCEDVNKSPIGVWQDGFTAENFQNRADNNNELDNLFAFDFIKINPITSDDPVFEMDPAFKSDDLEAAFVATCYFDDFDADVLAYATENAIVYDETKLITTSRMSDVKKLEKVTPEVMDLIGEGWKAWIKIDLEGNWYGRNIQCIEDRTQHADNTGHDGYIPFYCGRRIPLIRYRAIESSSLPVGVYLSNHSSYDPLGSGFREYFSASCLYYLDNDSTLSGSDYYPNTYTKDVNLIGAYRAPTVTNPELTEITQSNHAYEGDKFVDSFKRWRVHFKPGKGFAPEHDEGGYWVIGMNVNHKEYFDEHILNVIKRLQSGPAQPNGWETYLDGDAIRALQDVTADGNDEAYIGGSDAFYNYHPAGFVQGWGGLAKEVDYFDIHMGHMIDGSYLKDAIFFVMATNSTRKPKTHSC